MSPTYVLIAAAVVEVKAHTAYNTTEAWKKWVLLKYKQILNFDGEMSKIFFGTIFGFKMAHLLLNLSCDFTKLKEG